MLRSMLLLVSLFVFLAAIGGFATDAQAQRTNRRVEVFAEGGLSTTNKLIDITGTSQQLGKPPAGDVTVTTGALRTTGRLIAGVRFYFTPGDAVEVSYSYSPSDLLLHATCSQGCSVSNAIAVLRANFVAGNYVRQFRAGARFEPFLTAGAGVVAFRQMFNFHLGHDPFTADLGGGFDVRLSRHWSIRAEYRDWIFELPRENTSTPTGIVHNSAPTAGIAFRF